MLPFTGMHKYEPHRGSTFAVLVLMVSFDFFFSRHGIHQLRTAWADGPVFVTQCPIRPGGSYTYRFTIENQEGTLWWHAHSSWLRATVYGALVILPKAGSSYPFAHPKRELPILLGNVLFLASLSFHACLPLSKCLTTMSAWILSRRMVECQPH